MFPFINNNIGFGNNMVDFQQFPQQQVPQQQFPQPQFPQQQFPQPQFPQPQFPQQQFQQQQFPQQQFPQQQFPQQQFPQPQFQQEQIQLQQIQLQQQIMQNIQQIQQLFGMLNNENKMKHQAIQQNIQLLLLQLQNSNNLPYQMLQEQIQQTNAQLIEILKQQQKEGPKVNITFRTEKQDINILANLDDKMGDIINQYMDRTGDYNPNMYINNGKKINESLKISQLNLLSNLQNFILIQVIPYQNVQGA